MTVLQRFLLRVFVVTLVATALPSCSALRAPAVAPSAFLDHGKDLKEGDHHSPFLRNWTSPDAEKVLQKRKNLWIAPVNLGYLRPMSRNLSASEYKETARQASARKLASYASSRLADAFDKSPSPRYKLVTKPDRNTLTLELAFVELNPNPISGGMLRTAVSMVAAPGLDSVLLKSLKGNIAIEGKVIDAATKHPVFEFADNQENKSSLIVSVNDFRHYGQARQAIDEWATQIEQVLRTPPSTHVSRASAFVILPWH